MTPVAITTIIEKYLEVIKDGTYDSFGIEEKIDILSAVVLALIKKDTEK